MEGLAGHQPLLALGVAAAADLSSRRALPSVPLAHQPLVAHAEAALEDEIASAVHPVAASVTVALVLGSWASASLSADSHVTVAPQGEQLEACDPDPAELVAARATAFEGRGAFCRGRGRGLVELSTLAAERILQFSLKTGGVQPETIFSENDPLSYCVKGF